LLRAAKALAAKTLLTLGYSIKRKTKKELIQRIWGRSNSKAYLAKVRKALRHSKSQLGQDILGLSISGLDKPGYFVEFGAADGIALSNTFVLEKQFGWSGILCEPATNWRKSLESNRDCAIDTRCVYSVSGESVSFSENYLGELSSITKFASPRKQGILKRTLASYQVETVSLIDLLDFHKAPKHIEFLSIDTEGSEFEILNEFDFQAYTFGSICVEHNFGPTRELINSLLTTNGYSQAHADLSEFDDWYVFDTRFSSKQNSQIF
jgi:FkbM family methyltransferase